MYEWFEKLEKKLLGLLEPDLKIFLHMPYKYSAILKGGRQESADELEKSIRNQKNAEKAYIELANLYDFKEIKCVKKDTLKTIGEIHEEVVKIIDQL